jgi:AraC-like DNA-binding protein
MRDDPTGAARSSPLRRSIAPAGLRVTRLSPENQRVTLVPFGRPMLRRAGARTPGNLTWPARNLLAARAGVSRATLSRRFAAATGLPPIAYLTHWRTELAKEALRSSLLGDEYRATSRTL